MHSFLRMRDPVLLVFSRQTFFSLTFSAVAAGAASVVGTAVVSAASRRTLNRTEIILTSYRQWEKEDALLMARLFRSEVGFSLFRRTVGRKRPDNAAQRL